MTALSLLVKATIILVLGLAFVRAMPRARASRRFAVLAWTFMVLAVLPAAVLFGPALPVVVRETRQVAQTEPPSVLPPEGGSHNNHNGDSSLRLPPLGGRTPVTTDTAVEFAAAAPARGASAMVVAATVWALGVCLSLIPIVMTVSRLRRLRRTARAWSGDNGPHVDGADVLLQEQLSVPITFGARRPVILFPADSETWTEADVRRALAHELEHVRRGDWTVHVLARVVCAFYWFHPLVWQAWRQLTLEADRACDDAVVSCSDAREFAEQLVTLAGRVASNVVAPALSIVGSDLATRVNALLNPGQVRGRLGIGVAVAISAAAVTIGTTVAAVQAVDVTTVEQGIELPGMTVDLPRVEPLRAQTVPAQQPIVIRGSQRDTFVIDSITVEPTRTPAQSPVVSPAIAPGAPPQNRAAAVRNPPDYVIGVGDVLAISYFREKEWSRDDFLVRPDGKISLPFINEIDAAGLTPEQLRERITAASAKYLVNPVVTVGVRTINSRKVYIVGGIMKPGAYDLLGELDVLQLIAMAGGLNVFVNGNRNIDIIRREGERTTALKFNYKGVVTGVEQNVLLKPGDTVVVPE